MPEKKRFLKSVNVNFISLVDKGANQKTIIFKSADPTQNTYQKTIQIKKVDSDQHMVYGIVYSPDQVDTDGDFTTAEVIKQMAYDFMKNLKNVNIDKQHDSVADEGFVAESWLTKENDSLFPKDPAGSWAVGIKVEKEDTWAKVKSGEISGLSMAGLASVEMVQTQKADVGDQKSEDNLLTKIGKAIKEGFTSLKKDFNSALNQRAVRDYVYTLERAIDEILYNEEIADKKPAIMESIDQFKSAMEKVDIMQPTSAVAKAGKVFNSKNLKSLKDMHAMIGEMISQMESEEKENNIQKNNNGVTEMTPEEVKELVKTSIAEALKPEAIKPALEEALKPVNENIQKMKDEVNQKAGAIEQRLEKVEKASPGSAQTALEGIGIKKDEKYTGPSWLT